MKHVVTSLDGVQFVVNSHERSVAFDRAFAAQRSAAQLESHGDFEPVSNSRAVAVIEDVPPAWAEARERAQAAISRRAGFVLIQGGKS
jgi:hypothetical protein